MRRYILPVLFILLLVPCLASAQKFMLLERPGRVKNFKYHEGQQIRLQLKNAVELKGDISRLMDTSIAVGSMMIPISDISCVYRQRLLFQLLHEIGLNAGLGYLTLDVFNRAINRQYPTVEVSSVIIGGSLTAMGLLSKRLVLRKFMIGKDWRVRIIDFSALGR